MKYTNLNHCRILDLMSKIETITQKCFGEVYPELEVQCIKALDGDLSATYIINQLSKLIDELEAV